MSPRRRGRPGAALTASTGNASTLVGISFWRQLRLSTRMTSSSHRTMEISPPVSDVATAARRTAWRKTALALRRAFHSGDSTLMSIVSGGPARRVAGRLRPPGVPDFKLGCSTGVGSFIALAHPRDLARVVVVGIDNARDQLVPNNIVGGVGDDANSLDVLEQARRFRQARDLPARQINLAGVAGDDHAAVFAQARQKHLHLHRRGVLRLI